MIDLRNLNTGKKLIKHIIRNNQAANAPWSRSNQQKLKSQKNTKTNPKA